MVKIAGTSQSSESAARDAALCVPPDAAVFTAAELPSESDLTHAFRDCLACGIVTVDQLGTITGIDSRAETLTGTKAAVALGRSLEYLPAPLRRPLKDTLTGGKPHAEREITVRIEDRGDLALRVSCSPVKSAGRTAGAVMVLNDVSAARKWEGTMRRLDRLHSVGTLSASMAHEVKNAFVAVKTFVDLLLEQNKDADLAEVVRKEMNRIDAILSQMRRFSGPPKPQFARIRLHSVLDHSLQLIHHLVEEKKVKVTRSLAAPHDFLVGDADQLEQAFINLFFNALDAMKVHGKLVVATAAVPAPEKSGGSARGGEHGFLRVTIQDNGSGIPPEIMNRLFEPFFTTKADGTGLGLAITDRIVREHHGAITVNSEAHKGTAFHLLLPTVA